MAAFEVAQVIGSGNVQELICQTIPLPAPAEEIKEIRKTVIIDNCMVVFDKVIIDGRLRKDIMFKQANAGFPLAGNVQGCVGTITTLTGPIFDIDVDIAFNALIPVTGARPGDECVVLQAFVEGEKEEAANIMATGAFTALIDKSIVFLCVKVVREMVTTTLAGGQAGAGGQQQTQLCPTRMSTGIFAGGGLIPPARPGLVRGSWIGPTGIFPGVLNPGIPTTLPLPNTIISTVGSQIEIVGQNPTATTTGTGMGTTTT
jgi:hypothetical protein